MSTEHKIPAAAEQVELPHDVRRLLSTWQAPLRHRMEIEAKKLIAERGEEKLLFTDLTRILGAATSVSDPDWDEAFATKSRDAFASGQTLTTDELVRELRDLLAA